jgi:putative transcriptional regulator
MSVTHHPSPELLAGFAAGTLDAGEHLAVAVHASGCSTCRRLLRAIEGIGGSTLESIEPAPMKAGAFEAVVAKLDRSPPQPSAPADSFADDDLPEILRHYRIGRRRRVAPGVSMRPIELPGPSRSRAFRLDQTPARVCSSIPIPD